MLAGRRRGGDRHPGRDSRRARRRRRAPRSTAPGSRTRRSSWATARTHKTLATVDDLCRRFAQWGLLRGDAVVALGGGVVGDTAGFAAAVYYRGVDVVQVPTTLLAMVDSAIGGKTGVNLPEGKNLVGAFHQPLAVLADPGALATLPDREYRCGLGEIAKYALMGDDFVSAHVDRAASRATRRCSPTSSRAAPRSRRATSRADELERTGTRAVLNYGHTLAHALETASGHALLHGEAVAIGLVFAAQLAGTLERIDQHVVAHHEYLVAGARAARPRRRPGCGPTTSSRSWRATRSRAAGSRSCSRGRAESSGSTTRTRPRCARRSPRSA